MTHPTSGSRPASGPDQPGGRPDRSANDTGTAGAAGTAWVLVLAAAAQFVLQLDFSIINVALPAIQRRLGFTAAGLQWVVTGYALTYGALLLVAGRAADLIGRKRALLVGLTAFGLSSLAGGLATSALLLVVARLAQGASAALVAPGALGVLTDTYTTAQARARALGVFQGSSAAGATAGIVLGGVLTEYLGWRSVLLVNPPVIAVLAWLMARRLPADRRGPAATRLDLPGAALATTGAGALIYGLSEGQQRGFGSAPSLVPLLAAALLTGLFVLVESRSADPMLPLTLLRDRARRTALVVMVLLGGVVAGYVYFVSLYLQRVRGMSTLLTGLALIPATALVMAVSILLTRRIQPRLGLRRTLLLALAFVGVGQLWLSTLTAHSGYATHVLPGIVLTAIGMGLAFPTSSVAITSDVPPALRGLAGSMFVTAQQLGSAVGLAVLATIAAARTGRTGSPATGYALSYLVATGIVALTALAVAFLFPRTDDRHIPHD
ncbi:MFS transporter [Streptomyces sp. NPDC001792]|uniref:MFS transporter n=1 Tax=Streptomyces sp. NPDC001792 TaxID=3154524 RepID=UPI00331E7C9D